MLKYNPQSITTHHHLCMTYLYSFAYYGKKYFSIKINLSSYGKVYHLILAEWQNGVNHCLQHVSHLLQTAFAYSRHGHQCCVSPSPVVCSKV